MGLGLDGSRGPGEEIDRAAQRCITLEELVDVGAVQLRGWERILEGDEKWRGERWRKKKRGRLYAGLGSRVNVCKCSRVGRPSTVDFFFLFL
jgi:hypothetical protein